MRSLLRLLKRKSKTETKGKFASNVNSYFFMFCSLTLNTHLTNFKKIILSILNSPNNARFDFLFSNKYQGKKQAATYVDTSELL